MVAAAVIGTVVSAGISYAGASKSAKAANNATAAQTAASNKNLAFQQQQYADWQAVYGPVQQNLSSFYQNLSGDALVASGLKNYEQQYQAVTQDLQRSFTQRGVDSPAQALLQQQAALGTAEFKATLRNEAPLQVAAAQQGFVDRNVVNPAAQGVSQQLSAQASLYGNQASQYNQQALVGYQAAGQAIQGGVSSYAQYQQYQQMQTPQYQQPTYQQQGYQPTYAAPINQPMSSGTIQA